MSMNSIPHKHKEYNHLTNALAFYELGVSVIPLRPRSKQPCISWEQFQHVKPPIELVERWFQFDYGLNYGVMVGGVSGNLVVLDFDAMAAFERWPYRELITYSVNTARGVHVYVRVRDLLSGSFHWQGCDVKTSGYVVGPGSVHPSGHVYQVREYAPIVTIDNLSQIGIKQPQNSHPVGSAKPSDSPPNRHPLSKPDIVTFLQRYTQVGHRRGRYVMARCPHPQHNDHTPSFRIDTVNHKATCLKPSCALYDTRGLDVYDLYAALEHVTLGEAIHVLGGAR